MTDLSSYELQELEKEYKALRCECNSLYKIEGDS